MHSIGTWWMWLGFFIFILAMLVIDIYLIGDKKSSRVSFREALGWTSVWVFCALLFNVVLWHYFGNQKALEFFTGYLIEKSLSIDNLFVFYMIFQQFALPVKLQQRVLIYGVLGALILRLIMILFGSWLVNEWHWMLYIFGGFLIYTGFKILFLAEKESNFKHSPVVKWMSKYLRIVPEFHGNKFFITKNNVIYATQLLIVLILIEFSDVIFALDSIPAIFAITLDPFIVFTSNIFAILGLRALYFLLAVLADRFQLVKYGIACLLVLVGLKMLIAPWFKLPITVTLLLIFCILTVTVILSWASNKKQNRRLEK